MTVSISLPPETEQRLRQRAAAAGKDLSTFVKEAVEEKLSIPETFAELLAPIHAETINRGLSEDDLDSLIEESRDEVHALRKGKPA